MEHKLLTLILPSPTAGLLVEGALLPLYQLSDAIAIKVPTYTVKYLHFSDGFCCFSQRRWCHHQVDLVQIVIVKLQRLWTWLVVVQSVVELQKHEAKSASSFPSMAYVMLVCWLNFLPLLCLSYFDIFLMYIVNIYLFDYLKLFWVQIIFSWCPLIRAVDNILSNDDCLEDKREHYQNCSVLYCLLQLCTMICTHTRVFLAVDCQFVFRLSLWYVSSVLTKAILFLCCLRSFVLGLVSSALSQEIGWEERLQNDLFCVEWDVKR